MNFLEDDEFGEVIILRNNRCKNIIYRVRDGKLNITVSPYIGLSEIKSSINKTRDKISALFAKSSEMQRPISFGYSIQAENFNLSVCPTESNKIMLRQEDGKFFLLCPESTSFEQEEVQLFLKKVICEAMRKVAKVFLVNRLKMLSQESGLQFNKVRINNSSSRWGSCSSAKNINLSLYLMLIPTFLIDYVLLHELCHTIEMNHSPKFWTLLDSHMHKDSRAVRKELRNYSPVV